MGSAANPLQASVYTTLHGDTTLMALLNTTGGAAGIYDRVIETAPFPYVVIGEVDLMDWSSFARVGQEGYVLVHTWSQAKAMKECKAIQDRVDTLLNRSTLSLSGSQVCVACIRDYERILSDPDGLTFHGVQRFKVWAQVP